MRMTTRAIVFCAALAVWGRAGDSSARICETCDPGGGGGSTGGGTPGDPLVCGAPRAATPEDVALAARWNCDQNAINHWWHYHDYDKENWDDGNWGYWAACDPRLPLAKAFNAHLLLDTQPWFGPYVADTIDELDGEYCDLDEVAWTQGVPGWDNYTNLYVKFFYERDAIQRAGILVHEARHAAHVTHTTAIPWTNCPRGKSCDVRYGDDGPNSYQIDFLAQYSRDCSQPLAIRVSAAMTANDIGARGFETNLFSPTIPVPNRFTCLSRRF